MYTSNRFTLRTLKTLFQWLQGTLRSGTFVIEISSWFSMAIVTTNQGNYTANGLDIGFSSLTKTGWSGGRDLIIKAIVISD